MLPSLIDSLYKVATLPLHYLLDPNKRLFLPYLAVTLLLGSLVYRQLHRKEGLWQYLFSKKVWWNSSAKVDYALFLGNGFVKVLCIAPLFYFSYRWAYSVNETLIQYWGYPQHPLSPFWAVTLYTIALVVVNDFMVYVVHYLFHKIPWLWEFHKVHHAATTMTPITLFRVHPIELLANNLQYLFLFGLLTGIVEYATQNEVNIWMIGGTNALTFWFYMLGANLRHSHIPLRYPGWLEHLLISPRQHQIHHSMRRAHWNKNFGSHLAIWDWIFGTLVLTEKADHLRFGISPKENPRYKNLWQNLWSPFPRSCSKLLPLFRKKQ